MVVRNSNEVEDLVRGFEADHKAFVAMEPRHRDVLGYHKMRAKFRTDLLAAVKRQAEPPKEEAKPKVLPDIMPAEAKKQ